MNHNEPAFARAGFYTNDASFDPQVGLTKREYIATQIMAGAPMGNLPILMAAKVSLERADALLKVLGETPCPATPKTTHPFTEIAKRDL